MNLNQQLSSKQLLTLSFVSMLSPFLRLIPGSVTDIAGSASWVCAALSILPAALLSLTLTKLLSAFPSGTGLGTIVLQTFGAFGGSLLLSLWALWLIFHSGFLLCSGADRFIATIYPGIQPIIFILVTAAMCFIAAMGTLKSIARASEIFLPLLLFVILLVIFFSLSEVEPTFLLPVTKGQTTSIFKGIPIAAEAVSVVLINTAFLSKFSVPNSKSKSNLLWLLKITVLNVLFCGVCVGSLGKTYVSALAYPFFILARDLSVLSGVERIESLVVGLWLIPDFVLITVEWMIASDLLLQIAGKNNTEKLPVKLIILCASFAVFVAFRIAPDSSQLVRWSEKIVPAIHLGWAYIFIPILFFVSALRKKF